MSEMFKFPAETPLQGPSSNFPTLDLRNNQIILDYDATTEEAAIFRGVLPSNYAGAGFTVGIRWAASGVTTGNVVWGVSFERQQADSHDMDADSFATEKTVTDAAPGTDGQHTKAEITFSNSEIDGLLAGELFRVKVARKAADASDTMAADAELLGVEAAE